MDGIILDELRSKTKVLLPKSKAEVLLWDEVLAGEVLGGLKFNSVGQVENTNLIQIVVSLIADWNFIDKDGNKLPINEDNVRKLSLSDFKVITEQIERITQGSGVSGEEKKS
jgi:hypothetical protein